MTGRLRMPWNRPPLALVLFVGLALAGCTEEPPASDLDDVGNIGLDNPDAILVSGMVVNDELQPVAGAQVTIRPGEQGTETDEAGAFVFAVLEPGEYELSAVKEFHDEAFTEVRVPKEGIDGIQLMVVPTPEGVPYHETETYTSYTFCSGPIGGGCFIINTVLATNYLPEDQPDFGYEVPNNGFKELRFEAQWTGNMVGDGGFIARNPEGLFLGCNNTQATTIDPLSQNAGKDYEPTKHYYSNNNHENRFNDDGNPVTSREPSPVKMWIRAGVPNPQVGGCHPMPDQKGDQIWQTVRISRDETIPHTIGSWGSMNVRTEVFLSFFYWAKAEDREFTVLDE